MKIHLKFTQGSEQISLDELSGSDELALNGTGSLAALQVLDRLLLKIPNNNIGPGQSKEIAIADRDRIFALLYANWFGDKIESTIKCQKCESLFDLSFSLGNLVQHLDQPEKLSDIQKVNPGIYLLDKEIRFRLPTGADECDIIGLTSDEAERKIIENCLLEYQEDIDTLNIQKAMHEIAPVISTTMIAVCVECEEKHEIIFDIQSFLLATLMREQKQTLREIHRLAISYNWSLEEINKLSRSQRKIFAKLIETEMETG